MFTLVNKITKKIVKAYAMAERTVKVMVPAADGTGEATETEVTKLQCLIYNHREGWKWIDADNYMTTSAADELARELDAAERNRDSGVYPAFRGRNNNND